MNAKDVLNKILQTLSLVKEEVEFVDAKAASGAILQSPTFDLGEDVEVVHEDGSKTPAPDGEHEIALRDSEGNEVVIRIVTKDGKITERENVEEAQPEVPEKGEEDMASLAGDDASTPETPYAETEEPQQIPQTMDEMYQHFSYRIEELEKKMQEMVKEDLIDKTKPAEKVEVGENSSQMSAVELAADGGDDEVEVDEEDELPKLDGAPVEENPTKLGKVNYGKKTADLQSTFLSKLYK